VAGIQGQPRANINSQVAADVFKHPWIQRLCNQISDELREKIDWIGIPERPEGNKMLDYACGNGVASRVSSLFSETSDSS